MFFLHRVLLLILLIRDGAFGVERMTKLMIVGDEGEGEYANQIRIVDLATTDGDQEQNYCIPNYPRKVHGMAGALLFDKYPTFCGGYIHGSK